MQRRIIPYNAFLKEYARRLRRRSTLSEVLLWRRLKGRRMRGYDFHRQKPLGHYIVDFYCCDLMLAIEIDGSSHNGRVEQDRIRQEAIERCGVRFLRFDDRLVKEDIDRVVRAIEAWIDEHEGERS